MDYGSYNFFAGRDSIIWADSWEKARNMLEEWHPNGARAVVYPDRTIQRLA
jgi:hypothetical protein